MKGTMKIGNYRLELTCGACPEQYDVFYEPTGEIIAYLRLRHGRFYAACPDVEGVIVYETTPVGDGQFEDYERQPYLVIAIEAIDRWRCKKYETDLC